MNLFTKFWNVRFLINLIFINEEKKLYCDRIFYLGLTWYLKGTPKKRSRARLTKAAKKIC